MPPFPLALGNHPKPPINFEAHATDSLVKHDAVDRLEKQGPGLVACKVGVGIGQNHTARWIESTAVEVKKLGTAIDVVACDDAGTSGRVTASIRPTIALSP